MLSCLLVAIALLIPLVDLRPNVRLKRLSAYDPANLLILTHPKEVTVASAGGARHYRPMVNVVLAKEARSTMINGKAVPLWLGDGFVRIPKRPVVSTAQVIPNSAEQNVEVRFGGGPRPHFPYPRVRAPYRRREAKQAAVLMSKNPNMDALIVFKKKKRPHFGRRMQRP
ncbi:unnamed protein product [Nippostrongylus brasiliensis]|uniref:AMIN domain-containing protein n=1 Tax=Nippostrongylus brasiliensis TaxID=27835 RepID=A0A0N4XD29_NIPBR|nr:unnamed protein product [Nippostrongylus brasiliensis]